MSGGFFVLTSAPPIVSARQMQYLLIPFHHDIRMVATTIGFLGGGHSVSISFQRALGGFSSHKRNGSVLQRFARLPAHHQILDPLVLFPDGDMDIGNLNIDNLITILMRLQNRFGRDNQQIAAGLLMGNDVVSLMLTMILKIREVHRFLESRFYGNDIAEVIINPLNGNMLERGTRNRNESDVCFGNILVFNIHQQRRFRWECQMWQSDFQNLFLNLLQQFLCIILIIRRFCLGRCLLQGCFEIFGGGHEVIAKSRAQFRIIFIASLRIKRAQLIGHIAVCLLIRACLCIAGQLFNVPSQGIVGSKSALTHKVEAFQQIVGSYRFVVILVMVSLK